ncbi:MAG TPA: hypothetical protein PLY50_01625 [Burkholderiaceae bacterium]|nr:hypothetical protein [Burkholderiaceae bacterium]HRA61289.1 hypothetical protein [Burkholderiaceae bacterium]
MPNWKTRTLMVVLALMLAGGVCQAQDAAMAGNPSAPASSAQRSGTPSPYSPPVVVPSVAGQIQPLRLPSPTITITPAPTPSFSSNCDGSGCWGSDGTRYNAIGGALVRPDGRVCQNVGGVMSCP